MDIFSDDEESEEEIEQIQKSPDKPIEEVDYESFEQQSGLLLVSRAQRQKLIRPRVKKNPEHSKVSKQPALFKIVMIGDSFTGKTSLLLRFADNILSSDYRCTVGVDFKIKSLQVDDAHVKLQVWDTAG